MMRNQFIALLACVVVLLQAGTALARVAIDRKPPTVEHKEFDPKNKPADLPKLNPGEVAVCVGEFGIGVRLVYSPQVRREKDGTYAASVLVDAVNVDLQLKNVIWLPTGSSDKLKAHEEGHRQIAERIYNEISDKAARIAADKLDMQKFEGKGATSKAASEAAEAKLTAAQSAMVQSYLDQTSRAGQKIQELYDSLTAHGTKLEVTEADAIKEAWNKAPPPLSKAATATKPSK